MIASGMRDDVNLELRHGKSFRLPPRPRNGLISIIPIEIDLESSEVEGCSMNYWRFRFYSVETGKLVVECICGTERVEASWQAGQLQSQEELAQAVAEKYCESTSDIAIMLDEETPPALAQMDWPKSPETVTVDGVKLWVQWAP